MTCGITVAPRIPTASSSARCPPNCGVNECCATDPSGGWAHEELGQVADADRRHESGDDRLERPQAEALQPEDRERDDRP